MEQAHQQRMDVNDTPLMPIEDESYLCLLCLRNSTERIAMLYFTYIRLRQQVSGDTPTVLIGMLLVLQEKRNSLQEKLESHYPEKMAAGLWHDSSEQMSKLDFLSDESRESLQQICISEIKMVVLISEMANR
ncbi:hypothetical protein [Endozoicomonas ascidiicola]|uniref:hypothetical protein n=1 Tax=Endozoicomonas ascidiicola TaxID=1698521 RepID=UPI000AB745E6|nr:hypothetical protein [Endozoicomonas ascidiicola]